MVETLMADIDQNIAAYEEIIQSLESQYMGKWVIFHNRSLVDVFDSFENAAQEAVKKFGRGPYLIRQVGAPPVTLPASVMYNPKPLNAKH